MASERGVFAGQVVSEAGATIRLVMGEVLRIDEWKAGRAGRGRGRRGPGSPAPAIERLERAIRRLDGLTGGILEGGGALDPETEAALLAIVGQVSMGQVEEAAARTEDLVQRLAARR